ncbi:MAG: hypothetical protein RLZZ70_79 [Candidatus Parcubacteria bacterium]
MQFIRVLFMVVTSLAISITTAAAEGLLQRGFGFETRAGYQTTMLTFGASYNTDMVSLSMSDGVAISGAKLMYRGALGNRWRFGPAVAYYGRGHESFVSEESLEYGLSGTFTYTDVQSATVGFQLGYVISPQMYIYSEAGYAGQHSSVQLTVAGGGTAVTGEGDGYVVGPYVAFGAAFSVTKRTAFTLEWQEVFYSGTYTDGGSKASIDINQQRMFFGFEIKF